MEIRPFMLSLQLDTYHTFLDGADSLEAAKDLAALHWNDQNKKWGKPNYPGKIHIWQLTYTEAGPRWSGTEFPGG